MISGATFSKIPNASLHVKHNENTHNLEYLRSQLLEGYEKYQWGMQSTGDIQPCEESVHWKVSYIDSVCAKWLYRLNSHTKSYIKTYTTHFGISPTTPYLSIQIRLNDKKSEMDPHQC